MPGAITVGLYTNTENELIADKQPTAIGSYSGDIRGQFDYLNPTVLIEAAPSDVENANYMSITAGNDRYYFITSKKAITGSLWEVTGRADLRATYRYAILASDGIVSRNTYNYDMYLKDDKIPIRAHKTFNVYSFGDTPFKGRDSDGNNLNRCIMQVLGG